MNEVKEVKKGNKKINKSKIFVIIASAICFLSSVAYLAYTLLFCSNKTNNLFLIISSFIIFLVVAIFSIGLFMKRKIRNILCSIGLLLMSGFIMFNLFTLTDIIKIPTQAVLDNFMNKNINELLIYGEKNNITINQLYEYSDTVLEYNIISQDILPNTLLKDVKELNVVVSSGPNYDKAFVLQNLVGLNIDEALKITNENFMNNIEIEYEINDENEKDIIISQSLNGQIKRNDLLKLVVSLGAEGSLKPVKMESLKNKSLFEATLWLKRNGIKYELTYEFSDTVSRNYCVSQSEKEGTEIDPNNTTITLIVSKGAEINIPDFTSMDINEATNWIIDNNLKLEIEESYDNEIEKGKIISSDKSINTKLEEGSTIKLTISKGKLKMEEFENINAFRSWANSLGLEYEENSEFSDLDKGMIISSNPKVGEYINLNEKIEITYSKGKSTTIPNFYNKTKSEASSLCSKYKLNCYYSYRYSSSVSEGYISSQSMSKNSTVAENTSITLYISKGKEPVIEVPTCDKSKTTLVWITPGNDGSQTKANLSKEFSNVKWQWNMVDKCPNGDSGAGTVCNANEIDGKRLNHCDDVVVTIVK